MAEKITIPEKDIVSLDAIADGITGLRIAMVNVFAVSNNAGDWTLFDAGLPHTATLIKNWAAETFGAESRPRSIILTHGHFDHSGAAKVLADSWGVEVYAHPLEIPYITGQAQYPPPDPGAGGGLMALLSPLYPREANDVGSHARELPADGTVPNLPEWSWVHTPGHTDGHVSFFREGDRALILGDAFCTTKAESLIAVATQPPELHGPPNYFTSDWDAAKRSVEKLSELKPLVVAPGHGKPLVGENVAAGLQQLAEKFDEIARPKHGRHASGAQ